MNRFPAGIDRKIEHRVRIIGLQSRPELNGLMGWTVPQKARLDCQRYGVLLDHGKYPKPFALKLANLEMLADHIRDPPHSRYFGDAKLLEPGGGAIEPFRVLLKLRVDLEGSHGRAVGDRRQLFRQGLNSVEKLLEQRNAMLQHPLRSAIKIESLAHVCASLTPEWNLGHYARCCRLLQAELCFMAVMSKALKCDPLEVLLTFRHAPARPPSYHHGPYMNDVVIQECVHEDAAAAPDGSEQDLVETAWASQVEAGIHHAESYQDDNGQHSPPEEPEEVFVLSFSRYTKEWRQELAEGSSLRQCRDALTQSGFPWELLSGAKIFVHPRQYQDVRRALHEEQLRPYHIVVTASLEYLVEESLTKIKRSLKVKKKSRAALTGSQQTDGTVMQHSTNGASGSDNPTSQQSCPVDVREIFPDLAVRRTFLCTAPQLRGAASVVQSTPHGVVNPRRVITTQ